MSDRPILDIPLDTSAFEAFRAKFDAFRAKTAETSGAWAEVGKTTTTTAQTFDKLAARLAKMQEALAGIQARTEAAGEEQSASSDHWTHIASSAKVFSANVKDASLFLAKWSGLTGLFAGILSAGGLYGISRMAAGVGARRSGAMSYGLGYGEYQSYQTNFARLGNAGGLLSGFNQAMMSAESRGPLYTLMGAGADRRLAGKDAAGALAEALPDIKRFVDRTDPRNLEGMLHGTGLDRLGVDVNTALTIRRMSPQEIDQIVSGYRSDTGPMGLDPEIAQKWQDFETTLDEAGSEIENHFAANLVNLTPGLTRLADATSDLVDHMLKDGGPAEKWLGRVNKGMMGFANNLGSKDSISSINHFINGVTDIGRIIGQIIATHGENGNPDAALNGSVPDDPSQRKGNRYINWLLGLNSHSPDENQRARDKNADTAAHPNLSKGRGMTGLRAAGGITPGVAPENADQSTWGANNGAAEAVNSAISKLGENRYRDRADLAEYMRTGGHGMDPARAAWCAAFVGASLEKAGLPSISASQGGNIATSYMRWGDAADSRDPRKGDVLIMNRGLGPGQVGGHVGLATGEKDARGRIGMISGNNAGGVGTSWEDPARVVARRAHENPDDKLSPIKPLHPHLQGQTNTVHVDDETGAADVHRDTRAVGPMSYGTDFGRFNH